MTAVTTTTPPGWYPEPGHTGNGPAMERWWDGSAWTEYTRTAPVPAAAPQAYPGYPGAPEYQGYPGYPVDGTGAPGGGKRTGTVVIALVASLVLIGAIVAGVLVLGKDDDKSDAKNTPTPTSTGGRVPGPAPQPSDGGSGGGDSAGGGSGGGDQSPRGDGKSAIDAYDQISLPVLDGWTGSSSSTGAGLSIGPYPCPGTAGGTCSLGGVSAVPAVGAGTTAKTAEDAAKQDIAKNASDSYNKDTYGATTTHQQVKAGAVTVAGQQGYLVRWKVVTASGTSGYVESLVFPSPTTKQLVLVRFGFDIGGKAPGPDVIDQITQGIKSDTSQGSGGSSGGTGV